MGKEVSDGIGRLGLVDFTSRILLLLLLLLLHRNHHWLRNKFSVFASISL